MDATDQLYPADAVVMAPLSGYTDLPFRRSARRHGCRFAFTPLIEVGSVIYGNPKVQQLLVRGEEEPWLGIQVVGTRPERLSGAMEMLADRRFEVVDFNMGCPVPKVAKRGAGAAMCQTSDTAARCVEALVKTVSVPVTAKIRILDEEDPAPTVRLAQILVDAGIRALTIHGRLWERIYAGPVAHAVIAAVRESVAIPVIANGGVMDWATGEALRSATGCGRIMLARGAIGNPWLFQTFRQGEPAEPSHEARCDEMEQHIGEMVDFYGESVGMRNARKIILAYLVGHGYRRPLRHQVTALSTVAEFNALLDTVRAEGPTPGFYQSR